MTTITPDMLKVIATADRIAKRMGGRFVPADTGETEAQEAAMQDDVERVARLIAEMRQTEIGADWGNFDDYTEEGRQYALNEARAAMAATLELTAEALRGIVSGQDETEGAAQTNIADWLQQRADKVKEPTDER